MKLAGAKMYLIWTKPTEYPLRYFATRRSTELCYLSPPLPCPLLIDAALLIRRTIPLLILLHLPTRTEFMASVIQPHTRVSVMEFPLSEYG